VLQPTFGAGLALVIDTDKVDALAGDRSALWERVTKAPFLTVNEKRAATCYDTVQGGDTFQSQVGNHRGRLPFCW
jgi:phage portal protein BeeE